MRSAVRDAASERPLTAGELAWLLLVPAALLGAALVALLAHPLGQLAFSSPGVHYWAGIPVDRKPAVGVGYPLAVACAVAYAGAIALLARHGVTLSPRVRRGGVLAVKLLGAGLLVACWIAQRQLVSDGVKRTYFKAPTVLVAALLTAAAAALLAQAARRDGALARLRALLGARAVAVVCVGVAVVATCIWVLPAVYTDTGLREAPEALFLGAWFFDESAAVVNGRSPLVNMAAYGSLWPYAVAIPLRTFGLTYLTYTVTMASLTAAALLALFATLVRVTRRAAFALALYLPILGVSFWLLHGTLTARYAPGTYYGMFPLRYAGPALLALLTAVYVGRAPRPRASTALLFAAAGLVALNNLDFGVPAAGATVGAVAIGTRPWTRRALARLAGDAGLGLLAALAAVSLLTLVRAGTLPHLGLLLRYGHYFVVGGTGNVPLAPLGLHVAITLTFLAALATAVVGGVARERDVVLDGMLAWSGLFGLGAGIYYYAYRSHPDVLVNLFPIWAFALALLIVAIVREAIAGRRRVGLPALAVLFAFALVASSLAQAPAPWDQVRRIRAQLPPPAKPWFPSEGFRGSAVRRIVAERTRPHERILLLSPMGHRIAEEVGVVNVAPYPGLGQMPAREQLGESLRMLRDEGGDAVFVSDRTPPEADEYLRRRGFTRVGVWTGLHGWPVSFLEEYRR